MSIGLLLVIGAALCIAVWFIVLLVAALIIPGKHGCNESECDSCPFPCEKHQNTPKL